MNMMVCLILGYFTGALNPAYLFGRLRGIDIREGGSGNCGATNATLLLGKATGFLTAFLDIAKSCLICRISAALFPALPGADVIAGCGCILGHIFPVWMGFAGGKGLACLGGMLLAYNWRLLCLILLGEFLLLCCFNYICLVALTASTAFTFLYWFRAGDLPGTLLLAAVTVVIFIKHIPNLRRIANGSELKIRYLWDKEGETRRVQEKHPDLHL